MEKKTVSHNGTKGLLKKNWLLLLAVLLSPFCCFSFSLLEFLLESLLPQSLDFFVNLFKAEVSIYNQTSETLYLTPFSTTRGYPQIIRQPGRIRQRDLTLGPRESLLISYDSADMPLAGLLVCREDQNCRMAVYAYKDLVLESFEELPKADDEWINAHDSAQSSSPLIIILPCLGMVPLGLYAIWLG